MSQIKNKYSKPNQSGRCSKYGGEMYCNYVTRLSDITQIYSFAFLLNIIEFVQISLAPKS